MDETKPAKKAIHFSTTCWSVVIAAGRSSTPEARDALEQLCTTYWFPLYAFVRKRGKMESDSKDLVQSFVLSLLERNDFRHANPEKGKFRTFLLSAFNNFLANEFDYRNAIKRGGDKKITTIDWSDAEARYAIEPQDDETPERLFDRQWGLLVIRRVLDTIRQELNKAGKESHYRELSRFLTGEPGGGRRSYAEIGQKLDMSESAVKSAVHRLRGRYRQVLRKQIAETVTSQQQVDEEIRALFEAISRK